MKIIINKCFGGFGVKEEILKDLNLENVNEDELRLNEDLIKMLEDNKNIGDCASELKVVEIPDDVKYIICDYDGKEHIAEQHRTWK